VALADGVVDLQALVRDANAADQGALNVTAVWSCWRDDLDAACALGAHWTQAGLRLRVNASQLVGALAAASARLRLTVNVTRSVRGGGGERERGPRAGWERAG
jgi:hypothetical protein